MHSGCCAWIVWCARCSLGFAALFLLFPSLHRGLCTCSLLRGLQCCARLCTCSLLRVLQCGARCFGGLYVLLSLRWLQSVARAAHEPLIGRQACPCAYRRHLDDAPRPALAEDADERCFVLVRALGGARGAARLQHILLPLRVCRQSAPCVLVGHRRALAVQQQLLDRGCVRLLDGHCQRCDCRGVHVGGALGGERTEAARRAETAAELKRLQVCAMGATVSFTPFISSA